MMMTTTVSGGVSGCCVSLCAGYGFSGTSVCFVFCRTGLKFTRLEFLRERKFCAADEKKQANDDASAPAMGRPVCGGAVKPGRSCLSELSLYEQKPSGRRCIAPWHRRNASQSCFQVPCRIYGKSGANHNISVATCRYENCINCKTLKNLAGVPLGDPLHPCKPESGTRSLTGLRMNKSGNQEEKREPRITRIGGGPRIESRES
jgi:hypothetical protein